MRITVEIDDRLLEGLVKMTGETKKSPAVARAVREYYYREKAKEFGSMLRMGDFDYPVVNEEMEEKQDTKT